MFVYMQRVFFFFSNFKTVLITTENTVINGLIIVV